MSIRPLTKREMTIYLALLRDTINTSAVVIDAAKLLETSIRAIEIIAANPIDEFHNFVADEYTGPHNRRKDDPKD